MLLVLFKQPFLYICEVNAPLIFNSDGGKPSSLFGLEQTLEGGAGDVQIV
jgi:hypothetical protein